MIMRNAAASALGVDADLFAHHFSNQIDRPNTEGPHVFEVHGWQDCRHCGVAPVMASTAA